MVALTLIACLLIQATIPSTFNGYLILVFRDVPLTFSCLNTVDSQKIVLSKVCEFTGNRCLNFFNFANWPQNGVPASLSVVPFHFLPHLHLAGGRGFSANWSHDQNIAAWLEPSF